MAMKELTHAQLVIIAGRWLRNQVRCGAVFCEPTVDTSEQPDAIGWHGGHSHVIECKVSRADALAEPRKDWRKWSGGMGNSRHFMMPWKLARELTDWTAECFPDYGLLGLKGRRVHVLRKPKHRELCPRASWEERYILEKNFQRLRQGRRFDNSTGRFEGWDVYQLRLAMPSALNDEGVRRT